MGQKDTSPPSGSRKEKSQGAAPKVGEQLNREKRKPGGRAQAQRKADPGTLPAGENLACRWNYHDRRVLSELHPWALGDINITGEGSSMPHPQADAVEPGSRTALHGVSGKVGNLCTYNRMFTLDCLYTLDIMYTLDSLYTLDRIYTLDTMYTLDRMYTLDTLTHWTECTHWTKCTHGTV